MSARRPSSSKRERARQANEARLRREQRPRFVNGPAATSGVPARRRLVDAASASVLVDARRRVAAGELRGPIQGVDCEPFPRNVAGIGADDSTELPLWPLRLHRRDREVRGDREHLRRSAGPGLPPADRLRHRALRVLQDRRAARRGPAQAAPGRDDAGRVRRRTRERRPAHPVHAAGSRRRARRAPSRPRPPRSPRPLPRACPPRAWS